MNNLADFMSMFRSPDSDAAINRDEAPEVRFWSDDGEGGKIEYLVVRHQPVLINFENSIVDRQTILRSSGASPVQNRRVRRSLLKRALLGSNPVEVRNAKALLDLLTREDGESTPILLVIGGGTLSDGVRCLHESGKLKIITFDIYASSQTDFVADAHAIPLRDGVIDAIWIQAVLEHVLTPMEVASEITRVLRTGGLIYAETPFLQPVHEGAYDFTRFTESGHRWLFRRFQTIDSGVVHGPGSTLFLHLRYFCGALLRSRTIGGIAALPFFWLRFFDKIVSRSHASDMASGVYFLGRKSGRATRPAEMPGFYRGVRS